MAKILLVEDELSIRELYADFLRDAGYEVDEAGDGELALSKITQGDWDILLLDVMLPKMDGTELLKTIGDNASLNTKPVIILSNLEDKAIIQKCMENGAKEFLVKAEITPPDVITAIERNLSDDKTQNSI